MGEVSGGFAMFLCWRLRQEFWYLCGGVIGGLGFRCLCADG